MLLSHLVASVMLLLVKAQLWQLAQRTTALPLGRGAFTLATTCTLLTEVFPFVSPNASPVRDYSCLVLIWGFIFTFRFFL